MVKKILQGNDEIDITGKYLEILKEYFPDCFTINNEFDMENFRNKINNHINISEEGYGINFLGKNYAKLIASLETTTVIEPDVEHNKKEENKSSNNIYISGDNLDALKHLLKSYTHKIKCVYIDPPYNTGNGDFIYNDNFNFSKEDIMNKLDIDEKKAEKLLSFTARKSSSHSAWLTFMYPRLTLARDLLSDDGVIFISIDDNEQANCKILCDSIFGEENFYGQLIQKKGSTQNDAKKIQRNADYILCYSKKADDCLVTYNSIVNKEVFEETWYLGRDAGASSGDDKLSDRINLGYTIYYLHNENGATGNNNKLSDRIKKANTLYPGFNYYSDKNGNLYHAIAINDYDKDKVYADSQEKDVYKDIESLLELGYIKIRPPMRKGNKLGRWTWSIESFKEKWNNNEVFIKNNRNVMQKIFVEPNAYVFEKKNKKYVRINNNLALQNVLTEYPTSEGSRELNSLFVENHTIFSNPKNLDMIKLFVQSSTNCNSFILDFFSGSATTAHAVMKLNAEDGGNRAFIMVQLPEATPDNSEARRAGYKNICEIGMERIRRAGKKIKEEVMQSDSGIAEKLDVGFKHYILKESSDNILDKLKEFNSDNENLFINNNIYEEYGKDTILTTWINQDGYGLISDYEVVNFNGYEAYYIGEHLYLIDGDVDEYIITNIIDKIKNDKNFQPKLIALFGYNFKFSDFQMIEKNINQLKHSGLNLDIKIDKRY